MYNCFLRVFFFVLTMSKFFGDSFLRINFWGTDRVYIHHFGYNFISRRMQKMPSMLTFSNRFFVLFAYNKRYLISVKFLHTMRKCLSVGCLTLWLFFLSVNLAGPMSNQDIVICFLLSFLKDGFHSPSFDFNG